MLCGSLDWRGVLGRMDTCVCMAESLCYPPETTTTLLIRYTPTQTIKLEKRWCAASLLDLSSLGCPVAKSCLTLQPCGLYGLQPPTEAGTC